MGPHQKPVSLDHLKILTRSYFVKNMKSTKWVEKFKLTIKAGLQKLHSVVHKINADIDQPR